jgi:hypothetical protein
MPVRLSLMGVQAVSSSNDEVGLPVLRRPPAAPGDAVVLCLLGQHAGQSGGGDPLDGRRREEL